MKRFNFLILLLFAFFLSSHAYSKTSSDMSELLSESIVSRPSEYLDFPLVDQKEHSMSHALPSYVKQKIPTDLIKEAVDQRYSIYIIGSTPAILRSDYFKNSTLKFGEAVVELQKKNKEENFRRPAYYKNDKEKLLLVSVMSGKDYIKQYTAMISYYIKFDLDKDPDQFIRVITFPLLENEVDFWTHLDEKFVKAGDVVLIGNVSDFFNHLKEQKHFCQIVEENENCYYKSSRVKVGDKTINFLRAKFSFWGNMSTKLVDKMMSLGAKEIVYLSKIATLESPSQIYQKIYSPTQFSILENHKVEIVGDVSNGIVKKCPKLATGRHISLSTVMEQDYETSAIAHAFASSLDLEVSKIAKTISAYNQTHEKQVIFSPIHWATDYIRTKKESELDTGFDLANGGSTAGKESKKKIQKRIYSILTSYLFEGQSKCEKNVDR